MPSWYTQAAFAVVVSAVVVSAVVVSAVVAVGAVASPLNQTVPDYEKMTYRDLIVELNKTLPENRITKDVFGLDFYENIDAFSCKGHCGRLTLGLCSCQPTCYPARNCCPDFRSECPLQFERLETDLWWFRHVKVACAKTYFVVSSCPSLDSPIHADRFKKETKTTFSPPQSHPKTTLEKSMNSVSSEKMALKLKSTTTPKVVLEGDVHFDNATSTISPEESIQSATQSGKSLLENDVSVGQVADYDAALGPTILSLLVTDVQSGLVFANSTIFACHGHLVGSPAYWAIESAPYVRVSVPEAWNILDSLMNQVNQDTNRLREPKVVTPVEPEFCFPRVSDSCPENYENQIVVRRCQEGIAYVSAQRRAVYANPFCLLCTEDDLSSVRLLTKELLIDRLSKFQSNFLITMKLSPRKVNFISQIPDEMRNGLYPNWQEYECRRDAIRHSTLAETTGHEQRVEDGSGQNFSPGLLWENEVKEAGPGQDLAHGLLWEADNKKSTPARCELRSCRVGEKREHVCYMEYYFNIRLPPTPKPFCRQVYDAFVPTVYKIVNENFELLRVLSSRVSLIGVDSGGYVYQVIMITGSGFDIMQNPETAGDIAFAISSVLAAAGMRNSTVCEFHGNLSTGVVPQYDLRHCPPGRDRTFSLNSWDEITCSGGRDRDVSAWVCGKIFFIFFTYKYITWH